MISNVFEKLLDEEIKISTRYGIVVNLDIEKLNVPECYSIDCLYNSHHSSNFNLSKVLFQINSMQNGDSISPNELKLILYHELDKIRKCNRCSKVYQSNEEYSELNQCATCELELDYIDTRKNSKVNNSFECGLCNQVYWKWFGKQLKCCSAPRVCLICSEKVLEYGFCPYCKSPIDESDIVN